MREQLVAMLGEKAGLDEAKANQVVDTVLSFIKDNPERLTALLADERVESVKGGLGKLFKR